MFVLAFAASSLLAMLSLIADTPLASPTPAPAARRVGEQLNYSLHETLLQSIAGKDAFGKTINQDIAPTNVKAYEKITVTKVTAGSVTVHRLGTLTVTVDSAKPVTRPGQGWTLVDASGRVIRDSGKLGGVFLLPLPFLGEAAVKAGDDLAVGDEWSAKLGTKLYAMTAQPKLHFAVSGTRSILGVHVFTIQATGQVPMREPVMTASGEPLGIGVGTARVTAELDYDRDNRRLVSLSAVVQDTLRYTGATKHTTGIVHDRQTCSLALDPSSMTSEAAGATSPQP
jgi:hypothetical protein